MTDHATENSRHTRLLVSVRNAIEAKLAIEAGVHLLDVKEPARGALGAAGVEVWQSVLEVAEETPVSAALGELLEYQSTALPARIGLAKFGLSGCAKRADWPRLWGEALATLPSEMGPVAVIYADFERALAPRPAEVIAVGRDLGCRYVLVDTFDKRQGNLLDLWSYGEVQMLVEQVKQQGLHIVLAGSLDAHSIRALLPLQPSVVAVRGAACGGKRNGPLVPERVVELVSLVNSSFSALCAPPVG